MKRRFNFKLAALCAILSLALVVPALAQGKSDTAERFKQERTQMIKQMKLPSDKENQLIGVEEKYVGTRKQIIEDLKKNRDELNKALAAPNPDESKIKDIVGNITSGQDKLFQSFKDQRNEELGLLTPVEQGKYIAAMEKWRHAGMMKPPKTGGKKK